MTEGQMLDHFKCPIVTAELIQQCKENPKLWRPHPRLPNCLQATQYYAPYKTKNTNLGIKSTKRGCTVTADLDNGAATTLMARLAGSSLETSGAHAHSSPVPAVDDERAQKLKRLEEQEEAANQKKADQAAAREQRRVANLAEKESPKGKARTWLHGCQATMIAIAELKEKVKRELDKGLCDLYSDKMENHSRAIHSLKVAIQEALQGSEDVQVSSELAKATAALESYKQDRDQVNAILRTAKRGNDAKRT